MTDSSWFGHTSLVRRVVPPATARPIGPSARRPWGAGGPLIIWGRFIRSILVVPLSWGLGVVTAAQAAPYQPVAEPEEDPRPRAALAACGAGDAKKGVAILAEIYAETRNPAFVFNQARCFQQNGQLEPARQRFAEYLRVGKNEPAEDLRRAQAYVGEIDAALARQPPRPAPAPTPAGTPTSVPTLATSPPPGGGTGSTLRAAGVGLTILGLAALGTGVYLSFKVQSTQHDVEQRFADMGVVTDPAALRTELANGGRYETWQWVSYGVGVAALGGAVTTFLLGGLPFSGAGSAEKSVALVPVATPGQLGGVMRWQF